MSCPYFIQEDCLYLKLKDPPKLPEPQCNMGFGSLHNGIGESICKAVIVFIDPKGNHDHSKPHKDTDTPS